MKGRSPMKNIIVLLIIHTDHEKQSDGYAKSKGYLGEETGTC